MKDYQNAHPEHDFGAKPVVMSQEHCKRELFEVYCAYLNVFIDR